MDFMSFLIILFLDKMDQRICIGFHSKIGIKPGIVVENGALGESVISNK